jgi:hypothetical protein
MPAGRLNGGQPSRTRTTAVAAATSGSSPVMNSRQMNDSSIRTITFLSEEAFGHSGVGGSVGFADPRARMSFGYVMSGHGPGIGLNERGQSLIDATYRSLGCTSNASGGWARAVRDRLR